MILIHYFESKKLVLVDLSFGQARDIRGGDIYPLIAHLSGSLGGFDVFELDQHPFCVWTNAGERHRLVFFANKKLSSAMQPLGKVSMKIHNDFSAQAMRTAEEPNHQIDRLAVWRAWSVLRISHYSGSTTSRVACLPSRSAATRKSVRMELATLPPLPITRPMSSFETLSSIRTREPPPLCRTCTSSGCSTRDLAIYSIKSFIMSSYS